MTDPLRPLLGSIASITRTTGISNSSTTAHKTDASHNATDATNATKAPGTFVERLTRHLSGVNKNDRKQLRKAFVEVALLNELGDQLIVDADFPELVERISDIIALDERAVAALDDLLGKYAE